MRLDKFLGDAGIGTRNEVKALIRKGQITVNAQVIKRPEHQIDPAADKIACGGQPCLYEPYVYYMLHKPAGVVTAVTDRREKTVMSLLSGKDAMRKNLAPAGRLDKDAEGLLLLTDDGALAHALLSPAKHTDKTYLVYIKRTLSDKEKEQLEAGVDIGDAKPTLPAKVRDVSGFEKRPAIHLTIQEGRFHQVKRMLAAVENEALYLKRLSMGGLWLDDALAPGAYRKLTEQEIGLLHTKGASGTKNCMKSCIKEYQAMFCRKKAMIFDLDGTLVDSMGIWKQIDVEYLALFGIAYPNDLQKQIEGKSFFETACYFKEHFQLPCTVEEIMQTWNQMSYEKYTNAAPLKPGVKETLDYAKAAGMKLGIATSNAGHLTQALLTSLKITDYFSAIVTSQDIKQGKPAPDIYLLAAKKLGIQPKACLVFEDLTAGIVAGKRAGMQVCAVGDAYSMYQDEEKRKLADYYIPDFTILWDARQAKEEQP